MAVGVTVGMRRLTCFVAIWCRRMVMARTSFLILVSREMVCWQQLPWQRTVLQDPSPRQLLCQAPQTLGIQQHLSLGGCQQLPPDTQEPAAAAAAASGQASPCCNSCRQLASQLQELQFQADLPAAAAAAVLSSCSMCCYCVCSLSSP